ncbi:Bug family tripartite tricarboxylate transporter substrate binding protein [Aureimonas populi]|uniref:Bug family tripartite tricarboxylate transporter substrate binding protein n=1 Tax=Aureimonas populi TaxID=1701758 RepID=A0ABW5CPT9_9HYPH|nr:tripartite tricarboxylate transporter substrate binding protein [Aureimonas populi]
MRRRSFMAGLLLGLAPFASAPALAQGDYPSEPIHIVVVWPAGGGHDLVGRLLGQELSAGMGVPVVVDNVTGAAGSTGLRHLENAAPDGYTIGIMGMHAVTQSFMNVNAPKLEDFTPLAYIADEPGGLQVAASTGIETVEAYVEAVRSDPFATVNGNDAPGGNSFVFANVIREALGVEMMQVPYQGHAATVTALATGEIQSSTLPVPPVLEHVRAGTVRMLAVAAPERHPLLPDVPTFAEAGHDIAVNDFIIVAAPDGLPEAVRARLEEGLLAAIGSEGFGERASANGLVLRPGGADMAAEELGRQVETIYPLLDSQGLVAEQLRRD